MFPQFGAAPGAPSPGGPAVSAAAYQYPRHRQTKKCVLVFMDLLGHFEVVAQPRVCVFGASGTFVDFFCISGGDASGAPLD